MHFSHHRADQTLDVSSKVRSPRGPKTDLDPMFLTAALQSVGVELTRVVEVNCLRQTLARPIEINVLSGQELVLWQHRHGQRKGNAPRSLRPDAVHLPVTAAFPAEGTRFSTICASAQSGNNMLD